MLVHYDLLYPCCGRCSSVISFMISRNFLWAPKTKPSQQHLSEAGLPATSETPVEPISNPFLQLCLMWTNGVGLAQQLPWSPFSLPLMLVFSIPLRLRSELWGLWCLSAGFLCGNLSSHTSWGTPCWGGRVGPICPPPSKPEDAQCWLSGNQHSPCHATDPFPLQWTVAPASVFV